MSELLLGYKAMAAPGQKAGFGRFSEPGRLSARVRGVRTRRGRSL